MAKRKPGGPAPDQSLILRSAESLGRMIGALQRQLDAVSRQKPRAAAKGATAAAAGSATPATSSSGARKRAAVKAGAVRAGSVVKSKNTRKATKSATAGRKPAGRNTKAKPD